MTGLIVALLIIGCALFLVYASGVDIAGFFVKKPRETREQKLSRCCTPLAKAPRRGRNQFRLNDPPETFFSDLSENIMDHLIMYWEMTHAMVDHIDYDNGFVVMSDGTMITQDGQILPPNGQEFYQNGVYTNEEQATAQATEQAPEVVLNYPYDDQLGGNLIRTPTGEVVPWMPEVPAPTYNEPVAVIPEPQKIEWEKPLIEQAPIHHVHTPTHHDYTPVTPSESPIHTPSHHIETPSYTPDPSPSYSDPSPSSPSE